jgi:glycosyltransferase involved in cell wall biosynthesis
VTVDGVTGFVVPRSHPEAAAGALETLVLNPGLRRRMGMAGREHVARHYSWPACIDQMVAVYESVLGRE